MLKNTSRIQTIDRKKLTIAQLLETSHINFNCCPNEVWTQISEEDFPGLGNKFISSCGRIIDTKGYLKQYSRKSKAYYLTIKGAIKIYTLHRVVAWHFVEGYNFEQKRIYVHHKDHNRHYNHATNLEWVTAKEHTESWRKLKEKPKTKTNFMNEALNYALFMKLSSIFKSTN
jgi:hypothetical protein